jgi:hypothetical protein
MLAVLNRLDVADGLSSGECIFEHPMYGEELV